MGIILLPLMFLVLYLIVILPQQRRVRAHQALVNVLEVGDEVMTTSGILGTVTAMDDEVLHLEVAPGVTLRVVRGAVARRMNEPEPEPELDAAAETEPDADADADTDSPPETAEATDDDAAPADDTAPVDTAPLDIESADAESESVETEPADVDN
jgi:preprotein translocase subunit YajC